MDYVVPVELLKSSINQSIYLCRKRKYSEEESEPKTFFEETQEISDSEGSDESSGEEDWRKKLKKPR